MRSTDAKAVNFVDAQTKRGRALSTSRHRTRGDRLVASVSPRNVPRQSRCARDVVSPEWSRWRQRDSREDRQPPQSHRAPTHAQLCLQRASPSRPPPRMRCGHRATKSRRPARDLDPLSSATAGLHRRARCRRPSRSGAETLAEQRSGLHRPPQSPTRPGERISRATSFELSGTGAWSSSYARTPSTPVRVASMQMASSLLVDSAP
jgi:hypothetical protein